MMLVVIVVALFYDYKKSFVVIFFSKAGKFFCINYNNSHVSVQLCTKFVV